MEKRYDSAELHAAVMTGYNSLPWVTICSHKKTHILNSGISTIHYSHALVFI